ncbi:MAG: methionine--tRNA ligase [Clostridiales bacterium]|nr:methionine--tRNA ligase [Clostridiales bacterium]
MSDKFFITTAIAYTSKKPHVGNTYEIIFTDAIARFKRMMGNDVFFLTGTDEHGQKIEQLAKKNNMEPKQYADMIAREIRDIYELFNCSYDKFIRTTDPDHVKVVQKIFKRLYEQGDIYKDVYEGHYCVACESFFTESQLENGACPDCDGEVSLTKEEAYFLKLGKYQDRLEKYIEDNPDFISPTSRRREMVNNFIKPGLQDLCVSRTSFKWGIPVDFDEGHVIYVWLDALSNYITALGYDPDGSDEKFNKYWPCDVHIIGKDILRFHTIYWPIMLMALDIPLPKQVFGHPWLLVGDDKMSKSKGNVIYADELADLFGVDAVRYYLLREMPYAHDGVITYEGFIERFNSDLANTIGNLVNRTIAMIDKYFDGMIQPPNSGTEFDDELRSKAISTAQEVEKLMEQYKTSDALGRIMSLARRSNKYIDETMPWVLAKDENKKEELGTVLYNLLESIRFIAVMLTPFIPSTAKNIFNQINCDVKEWDSLSTFGKTIPCKKVGEGKPLFNRIDSKKMLGQIEEMNSAKVKKVDPTDKEDDVIGIDDFAKVDYRVAKIIECQPVKKSDRLLKLQLNDGHGTRQVVSGIAQWYSPDDLIGKKIILVANLAPVKLRGEMSNGMILAADNEDGSVAVIFVDDDLKEGSKIR